MNQEKFQSREYFTKYTRRHELARFMVQYELFKKILNVKGSIVALRKDEAKHIIVELEKDIHI